MEVKAISYDKLRRQVDKALIDKFGHHTMTEDGYGYMTGCYLAELFDDYVIAEIDDVYYQIPYAAGEDGVEFAGREEWVKVQPERVWVEAKLRWLAAKFDIEAPCLSKAVKMIDAATRRIGAYATIWGELDCDKDRMTKTAIEPYLGKGAPYMFWLHGLDKDFGTNLVGTWDTASFKIDNLGLYVEGNVNFDQWGDKAWQRLEAAKSFGLSVGSIWYLVKKKALSDGTKEIVDWPLLDISIMEGGKQCVPSARQNLKADVEIAYRSLALKFGLNTDHDGGPVQEYYIKTGDNKMSNAVPATVDIESMVAQKVEAMLKAKADKEAAELAQAQAIEAKAADLAATQIAKAKEDFEKAKKELEAEMEKVKTAAKNAQPLAPATGGGAATPVIVGYSPYDRLSTMDLCIRYELLRSYGKQPSIKMWRALAERVGKMVREEDTLYIKAGQPVKVPAIDWEALVPKNLDLTEIDGEVWGVKAGQRFHAGGPDQASDAITPRGLKQFAEIAIKANEVTYSTQANSGDEWVPTLMNAQLWRTIRLNAAVLGLFDQFDMPSQPYDYPIESTDPVFYKVGETTDESQLVLSGGPFTDSKIGTDKVTFSAGKLGAISYWSEEMEEDGIIAVEPQWRDQYGLKFAHVLDEVLISGDETTGTSNISFDGSSIAATSRFLILDGLRHEALVTTTTDSFNAGALTIEDFGQARSVMGTAGKFGVNPNDLVYILDPGVWHKAYLLGEVLTVDKMGPMATVLTGQLGSLFGIPLVVSEDYALTTSAGLINGAGTGNTLGSFMCVNKRGVMVGWRRRPRIRVVGLPGAEARYIVGSARLDIQYKEAGMVGLGYAITI